MFHFRRRTLWIIIYLTIPLIYVLNNLSSEPDTDSPAGPQAVSDPVQLWSYDDVSMTCDQRVCALPLNGSRDTRVTAIIPSVPVTIQLLPADIKLQSQYQAGYLLAEFTLSAETPAQTLLGFLHTWLPSDWQTLIVSGAAAEEWAQQLRQMQQDAGFNGDSSAIAFEPPTAAALLPAPVLGDPDYLAFLLWIDALRQRSSSRPELIRWDRRRSQEYVLFAERPDAWLLEPVSDPEFMALSQQYAARVSAESRRAQQWHSFATLAQLYGLPLAHFASQPERLAELDLNQIEQIRENYLGQIQSQP